MRLTSLIRRHPRRRILPDRQHRTGAGQHRPRHRGNTRRQRPTRHQPRTHVAQTQRVHPRHHSRNRAHASRPARPLGRQKHPSTPRVNRPRHSRIHRPRIPRQNHPRTQEHQPTQPRPASEHEDRPTRVRTTPHNTPTAATNSTATTKGRQPSPRQGPAHDQTQYRRVGNHIQGTALRMLRAYQPRRRPLPTRHQPTLPMPTRPQTRTTPTTIKETRTMTSGDLLFLTASLIFCIILTWAANKHDN